MKQQYTIAFLTLVFSALFFRSSLQAQPPAISYQQVVGGLSAPVDVVNAHDGTNRLFIVQQGGLIKVWNGITLSDFINLSSIISKGGERGLLSLAFQPGFNGTTNRYFFVYYTNTAGNIEVSRYQTTDGNPNTADPATGTVVITILHPTFSNHNGGKLNFGPDGYLYFATGDGGNGNDPPNNAQTGTVLLGKMLRIRIDTAGPAEHPNYTIPAGNPYLGSPTVAGEVWNLGLRNPFRWSFDRANGNMWIGDVGQAAAEEIDYRPADSTGSNNFGWHCVEGYNPTPGVTPCTPNPVGKYVLPVYAYLHPATNAPGIAITGGYVYRGAEYPNFNGYYIASEFYSGNVVLLWPNGTGGFDSSLQTGVSTNYIAAFGEDEAGALYAVSESTNALYKVVATGGSVLPVVLSRFSVAHFSDHNEITWATANEINTARFYIEYSTDATHYTRAGQVAASGQPIGSNYTFRHSFTTSSVTYYRIVAEDKSGHITYSSVVTMLPDAGTSIRIYPTVVRNGILNLYLPNGAGKLQVFAAGGTRVFERSIAGVSGTTSVPLPPLSRGLYFVQVVYSNGVKREKVMIE